VHRLHAIIDAAKVMDRKMAVKSGSPSELHSNPDGVLFGARASLMLLLA
jgi:hypothetical protein